MIVTRWGRVRWLGRQLTAGRLALGLFLAFGFWGAIRAELGWMVANANTSPRFHDTTVAQRTVYETPYPRPPDIPVATMDFGVGQVTKHILGTAHCVGLDRDVEIGSGTFKVPLDWDETSDFAFIVTWTNTPGSPLADGETVDWVFRYQTTQDGELIGGTPNLGDDIVTKVGRYTQPGPGVDREQITTVIPIDADAAPQVISTNEATNAMVSFETFRRNSTDSYPNEALACSYNLLHFAEKPVGK